MHERMVAPLRILIVEDDDDARQSLRDILEIEGHQVRAVRTATAALEGLCDQLASTDIVILDRKLPDGKAEELLPRFRQAMPLADIIMITGYADLEGTITALREGVSDYIIKPINPDELLSNLCRISERRRIERELEAERQFAQVMLDTAEAIVLVLSPDGSILRYNNFMAELSGYALEEVVGKNWFETFIPTNDHTKIREKFDRTLNQRETRGIINPIRTKAGEQREIRWSNSTIKNPDGVVSGVLCIGLDVSDMVRTQQRLLQSERLATIGQTMTGLAHESRNALQRMQNAIELLQDDLQDNPGCLRDLEKIQRASRDLRDLLEEVRSFAAPIQLELSEMSISSTWRRAWKSLQPVTDRVIQLVESVASTGSTTVWLDERRMVQVFRNLFENALEACDDPVRIEIRFRGVNKHVDVEITDNGTGMSDGQSQKAFDAFFTSKPTGTGLGLAIVQRIIEAHNGTIEILPSDRGAKFHIRLPRNPSKGK